MQRKIPQLFGCWADPVAHLLLLKSSMCQAYSDTSSPYVSVMTSVAGHTAYTTTYNTNASPQTRAQKFLRRRRWRRLRPIFGGTKLWPIANIGRNVFPINIWCLNSRAERSSVTTSLVKFGHFGNIWKSFSFVLGFTLYKVKFWNFFGNLFVIGQNINVINGKKIERII